MSEAEQDQQHPGEIARLTVVAVKDESGFPQFHFELPVEQPLGVSLLLLDAATTMLRQTEMRAVFQRSQVELERMRQAAAQAQPDLIVPGDRGVRVVR